MIIFLHSLVELNPHIVFNCLFLLSTNSSFDILIVVSLSIDLAKLIHSVCQLEIQKKIRLKANETDLMRVDLEGSESLRMNQNSSLVIFDKNI